MKRKPQKPITDADVQRLIRETHPAPHWTQLTDPQGRRMLARRD